MPTIAAATRCVRRKMRLGRACPLDEQPDGAVAKQVVADRAAFCRHSEGRHRVDPFALRPERLAAGGDHPRCRVGAQQQLGHPRRCVDHMLAIVEHQHQLLGAERVGDGWRRCHARSELEPERGGDGDRNELGIGQRRELDGPNPIGKSRQQVSCDLQAEPCLADAAGAGQGDQPMGADKAQDLAPARRPGRSARKPAPAGWSAAGPAPAAAAALSASARSVGLAASMRISPVNW